MTSKRTNHHHPEIRLPDLPDWDDQQGQLDRLNDLWDTLTSGDRPHRRAHAWNPLRVARTRQSETDADVQARTIRALDRADDTPEPDILFLRDLRSALMDTSHAVPIGVFDQSPPISSEGGFPPPRNLTLIRPSLPSVLKRLSGSSMRILELAAVAALLLTMIGFAAGDRGIRDIRALLPASQDNAAELDSASYLGTAAHTGEMPGPGPVAPVGLLWRTPDANDHPMKPDSSPVVADGVVYLTTRTPDVETGDPITAMVAIDLQSGQPIWTVPLPGFLPSTVSNAPAVADGIVYVGVAIERRFEAAPEASNTAESTRHTTDGAVVALDAQTGQERWTFADLPPAGFFPPVVANGVLYIVDDGGDLHALDANSGELRWSKNRMESAAVFATAPTVAGDTIYVPSKQGKLYALDAADGAIRWSAPIGDFEPTIAVAAGDTVFVGTITNATFSNAEQPANGATPELVHPEGENLFAFDAETGEQRWAIAKTGEIGGAPIVAGDLVIITGQGAVNADVVAVSGSDGSEKWRMSTDGGIGTSAVWSGETVYIGSGDSKLYALDRTTGEIQWQVATGSAIQTTPAVADGVVAFTSSDGHVYALASNQQTGATPTASTDQALDVSGEPACLIAPRPEIDDSAGIAISHTPEGTPSNASVRPDYEDMPDRQQNILFADLPTGEPAPADVTDAIEATIAEMLACDRPGHEAQLASYYSDDFFRRNPMESYPGYRLIAVQDYLSEPFESATVLPDGRIAMLFINGVAESGNLVVWVEVDGRWAVDEALDVSEEPIQG